MNQFTKPFYNNIMNKKIKHIDTYSKPVKIEGNQKKIISGPIILSMFSHDEECFRIGNIPNHQIYFENNKYLGYDSKLKDFNYYCNLLKEFDNIDNLLEKNKHGKYLFNQLSGQVKDWLVNKKFKFYPSAFWSPEYEMVIIHPGKNRYEIMRMFPIKDGNYDFIFWNTKGYYDEWMDKMKKVEPVDLITDYSFDQFSFNHNSVIPQVFPNGKWNPIETLKNTFKSHKEIYNNLKIYTKNEKIKTYLQNDKFTDSAKLATVSIKINNEATYPSLECYKAFLCIFASESYKDDNLEVTILK